MKKSISCYKVMRLGFTVVELLVVVAILSILVAVTLVAYNGIQNKADGSRRVVAVSQMKRQLLSSKAEYGLLPGQDYKKAGGCRASVCVFSVHKTERSESTDRVISGEHGSGKTSASSGLSPATLAEEFDVSIMDGFSYINLNGRAYIITNFRSADARPSSARVPVRGEPLFPLSDFMSRQVTAPAKVVDGFVVCPDGEIVGRDAVVTASSTVPIASVTGDGGAIAGNGIYYNRSSRSVFSCTGHGGGSVSVGFPFVDIYPKGAGGASLKAVFRVNG